MRITLLIDKFPPKWIAGTEVLTYEMAQHLAKRGHDVWVITSLDRGLVKESIEYGFHIRRIAYSRMRYLGAVVFWIKMVHFSRKTHPDVIYAMNLGIGIPGFLAKMIEKIPYLVWCQGSDIYLASSLTKLLSKLVLKNANGVIALTKDMQQAIQKIWNREVHIIPNAINLELFEVITREESRLKFRIAPNEKIILFVGTLRPVKGLKYLIAAMNIIKQKDPSVRLILVGNGEDRHYLQNMVEELDLKRSVTFIGNIPPENVPEYMIAADLFVLPSLSEGMPRVILEAMASGLAIVATRVRGMPEIITNGENGFLVETQNPEQIAFQVLLLLTDDKLRGEISRRNREKARQFSWENLFQELGRVYLPI